MEKVLNNVDLVDVRQKLYNRLNDSGWAPVLRTFVMSSDFDKLLGLLLDDVQKGFRFTPLIKQVFRCFEECPYDKLKVCFLGQDPYIQGPVNNESLPTADGIAFSCGNTAYPPASLKHIFDAVENTVYPETEYKGNPDLARWANQGVLLINTAFTTRINQIGKHFEIWKPFLVFLLDTLYHRNKDLIYVFLGKVSQENVRLIPKTAVRFLVSHPASASYNNGIWNCDDVFNKVNTTLVSINKEKIIW